MIAGTCNLSLLLTLGGGGCSELRLCYCTPAWATRTKLSFKQKKKKEGQTTLPTNLSWGTWQLGSSNLSLLCAWALRTTKAPRIYIQVTQVNSSKEANSQICYQQTMKIYSHRYFRTAVVIRANSGPCYFEEGDPGIWGHLPLDLHTAFQ